MARERAAARRGEASRREPSWLVENTRIIRALGVGLPAARNMVIAARNPGRRVAGVDGEIPRTRTILRHSGNPVHVMGERFSFELEHFILFDTCMYM